MMCILLVFLHIYISVPPPCPSNVVTPRYYQLLFHYFLYLLFMTLCLYISIYGDYHTQSPSLGMHTVNTTDDLRKHGKISILKRSPAVLSVLHITLLLVSGPCSCTWRAVSHHYKLLMFESVELLLNSLFTKVLN